MNKSLGSSVAVWQGFRHVWGYNHRHKLFGSFVEHTDGHAEVKHVGASGWGPDDAIITDKVAVIRGAQGVTFQSGVYSTRSSAADTITFDFSGRQHQVELAPDLRGREHYAIVLNGFSMRSVGAYAHKIMSFDLSLEDKSIAINGNTIAFNILGTLQMDCRSFECYQGAIEQHFSTPRLERAFRETLVNEVVDRQRWEERQPVLRSDEEAEPLRPDNVVEQIDELPDMVVEPDSKSADTLLAPEEDEFEMGLREMLEDAERDMQQLEAETTPSANSVAVDEPKSWLQKLIDLIVAFFKRLFSPPSEKPPVRDKLEDARNLVNELTSFLEFYTRTKTIQRVGELTNVPTFPSEYELDVHYVIAAWDGDSAQQIPAAQVNLAAAEFEWGTTDESTASKGTATYSVSGYRAVVPYINGLSVNLTYADHTGNNQFDSEAMHFTAWNTLIDSSTDKSADVELLYRTQNKMMEDSKRPFSSFAHYFAGQGRVAAKIGVLALNAEVEHVAENRVIKWPGLFNDEERVEEQSSPTTGMTILLG